MKIAILSSTRGTILPEIFSHHFDSKEFIFITNKKNCEAQKKAKRADIPVFFVDPEKKIREDFDKEMVQILKKENVEFIFLIGYMRILSPFFIQSFPNKILNIHPSLLPAFAGGMDTDVHSKVLKKGCKVSGATLHYVTEEVDEGPIFSQRACNVSKNETVETLKRKVQALEKQMIIEALENL